MPWGAVRGVPGAGLDGLPPLCVQTRTTQRRAAAFLSYSLAEGEGFEPPRGTGPLAVFKTAPFNRSGTPPFSRPGEIVNSSWVRLTNVPVVGSSGGGSHYYPHLCYY